MKKISSGKKLPSYWATELLSYWHEKKIPEIFLEEKIKLPSYQATEQKIWDSIHITCHYCFFENDSDTFSVPIFFETGSETFFGTDFFETGSETFFGTNFFDSGSYTIKKIKNSRDRDVTLWWWRWWSSGWYGKEIAWSKIARQPQISQEQRHFFPPSRPFSPVSPYFSPNVLYFPCSSLYFPVPPYFPLLSSVFSRLFPFCSSPSFNYFSLLLHISFLLLLFPVLLRVAKWQIFYTDQFQINLPQEKAHIL